MIESCLMLRHQYYLSKDYGFQHPKILKESSGSVVVKSLQSNSRVLGFSNFRNLRESTQVLTSNVHRELSKFASQPQPTTMMMMASTTFLLVLALAFTPNASCFVVHNLSAQRTHHGTLVAWSASSSSSLVKEDDSMKENIEGEGVNIPKTGISVEDEMEAARDNRFETQLVKVETLEGVYQLVTTPVDSISVEPVRYLLHNDCDDAIMIDIPPYSKELENEIRSKVQSLQAILITSRNSIHYDSAPAVYSMLRRPDLDKWIQAFPDVNVVGYRLDVPRDCRFAMSQILDGYGPFAADEWANVTFTETGRPLTEEVWNETMAEDFMSGRISPDQLLAENETNDEFSSQAIRKRQEDKAILAIYTPGHTFGAVSYIFPKLGVCCTGYTVPCESNRVEDENRGVGSPPGPSLDYRGFITTSKDLTKQMKSAKELITEYSDRFSVALPSYGDPVFFEGNAEERRELMMQVIDQYQKLANVYHQLGIVSSEDE